MRPRVVIVGGGLAGLAAATALSPRGLDVTLLESRPRWGGRASSFVDQTTGETIDNCQHVILGCCNNFRQFCEITDAGELLRREPVLWFIGPPDNSFNPEPAATGQDPTLPRRRWLRVKRPNQLAASIFPAPLHLAPAFARFDFLSWNEKRQIASGLRALARERGDEQSFQTWLTRHGQSAAAIERFWHVVLVSALSESLDRIGVAHARKVFVDGFLRNRHGWEMWVPSVPLDELYGKRVAGWLAKTGTELRLQSGIRQVCIEEGRAVGVDLRDGQRLTADHVILAAPHHLVLDLLPETLADHPQLAGIRGLEDAPISSAHLWFNRRVIPLPHAVLVGRLSQWVFDRTPQANVGQYVQVVISASRGVTSRPQADVIQEVLQELTAIWPAISTATVQHARIVTEHRAALSPVPGVDRLRPPQQSPIFNLQLAGDWTQTGWPSTMEGAVRSGWLAAENVLRRLGRPESLLAPEPRTAWLSRCLLGL